MNDAPGFVRLLGRRDVVALAFGAMIGWSWVVLTGTWIAGAGALGAVLAFLCGGGVMVLIGLTYAELAAAMPLAGGEHVYAARALGPRAAFLCTWAITLGYVSVCAFEAVALPTVVAAFVPDLDAFPLWTVAGWTVTAPWVAIGVVAAAVITWLNVRGVRVAAFVQSVVVALILGVGLAFLLGLGFEADPARLEPLFVDGVAGLAGVLVMVPFLFVGFDVIPQAAEEIDLPHAAIGRLLVISVLLAAAWYALIVLGVGLALPQAARDEAELVTADAMRAVWGEPGAVALVLAGLGGILTSWNAFMVGGSRAIYAMARAGQLPEVLGRLHPRYRTPHYAIALIGGLSVVAPFFGRPALVWLVDAGGLGIVVAYATVAWAFLVLRRREPGLVRPYRVPAGPMVGRLALVLSIGLALLYLPGSPAALVWPEEWGIVLGWAVLGGILLRLADRRPRT
ncbi:MAG: APC family permease [Pseudomonadales bacterium]|nr:APC family permease [Pseudomonadales bacterium]